MSLRQTRCGSEIGSQSRVDAQTGGLRRGTGLEVRCWASSRSGAEKCRNVTSFLSPDACEGAVRALSPLDGTLCGVPVGK